MNNTCVCSTRGPRGQGDGGRGAPGARAPGTRARCEAMHPRRPPRSPSTVETGPGRREAPLLPHDGAAPTDSKARKATDSRCAAAHAMTALADRFPSSGWISRRTCSPSGRRRHRGCDVSSTRSSAARGSRADHRDDPDVHPMPYACSVSGAARPGPADEPCSAHPRWVASSITLGPGTATKDMPYAAER